MTIAIAPDVKGVTKIAVADKAKWREAKEENTRYDWSKAYMWMVWSRVVTLIVMGVLPVALIALTPWTLLGYVALAGIPTRAALASGKTSSKFTDVKAYNIASQLKDNWKSYGDAFYKQIWEHRCKGEEVGYSYYSDMDYNTGERRRNPLQHTNCVYCDKRLVELHALLDSQNETELKIRVPIENQIFESSEQFRKAISDQESISDVMKAISEGAKNG